MPKPQRNEKCPCGSEKKYKQCCLKKDEEKRIAELDKYSKGQDEYSENLRMFADYLEEEYKDHKVINISSLLNVDNYRVFQIKNYEANVIMIAEKNDDNSGVFASRGIDNDIIIMYRGSYRSFKTNELMSVLDSIDKMIQTRLAGLEDK
ncbi:SEC-C motif protein [Klosneuvirus KNV1]|uniref:SEC-C motif protein n=1 Tax=Klosneuvirus KNV1 TaxID=1977640 RepID=A0A1V0SJY6_9VIRU|nr:SEC-C motif protein [Klosneuvirus KNV1]